MERALIALFEKADTDSSNELNYQEFYDAFKSFSYDLTDNDIRTLIALADENANGKISWRDFIPVGIQAIKTFLARNKKLNKEAHFAKEVNKDTLKLIYEDEINKINQIFQRRFQTQDSQKVSGKDEVTHSGFLSFKEIETIFHNSSWLTPKEINILLRDACIKFGYDKIDYKTFADDLYDCRYELARSRIMDINISSIEETILDVCHEIDTDKTGLVRIQNLQQVLVQNKKLVLTPF